MSHTPSAMISHSIVLDFQGRECDRNDCDFFDVAQQVVTRFSDESLELVAIRDDRDENRSFLLVNMSGPSTYVDSGGVVVIENALSMDRFAPPTDDQVRCVLRVLSGFGFCHDGSFEFKQVLSVS